MRTAPAFPGRACTAAALARAAWQLSLAQRRVAVAWAFLAPTLAVLLLTAGWPLLRTIWFSLTDAMLAAAEPPAFAGVNNYVALVTDAMWWRAVANTAISVLASVALEMVLGVAIALVLSVEWSGQGLLRAAVLVPWAVPTVVSAKMWAWKYHDLYGVINEVLLRLGVIAAPVAWVADPLTALPAVIVVDVWLPTQPLLANYREVFVEQPFGRNLLNSLVVASGTVALAAALSCFAAYALGRVDFRGRRMALLAMLGVSMLPQVAVLSGLFEVISWLGLYDNLGALVISYMAIVLPFMVWMVTTSMAALPPELEEAASLDGAGPAYVLLRIFVPLLAPAIAATGLLAFMTAWNEFLFALTFTLSNETRTVPVAIALISGASEHELPWGRVMAASVIVTLPLVALTMAFQRRIVSGLAAGALGGQ